MKPLEVPGTQQALNECYHHGTRGHGEAPSLSFFQKQASDPLGESDGSFSSPEICSCPQPHTQTLLTCKGLLGGGGI